MAKERSKGERSIGIPTDDWNEFVRASKTLKELQKVNNKHGGTSSTDTLIVEVFNTTGAELSSRFPVLKLTKPRFTPDDDEDIVNEGIMFDGDTPDADTEIDQIGICLGPVGDEESIGAVLIGPAWVDVEFTDEAHTHAEPKESDNTQLASGTSGARIVWHPEIPDEEYLPATLRCCVLLGGGGGGEGGGSVDLKWGEVTTGATATDGDGEYTDDGRMDVFDDFGGQSNVTIKNYYPDAIAAGAVACIDSNNVVITWSCGLAAEGT